MIRTALSLIIISVSIYPTDVYSLEIEKTTPSLQYLYNYYYDPGALTEIASGIYFAKFKAADFTTTRKIMMVK